MQSGATKRAKERRDTNALNVEEGATEENQGE
jgi:hypothetical protein